MTQISKLGLRIYIKCTNRLCTLLHLIPSKACFNLNLYAQHRKYNPTICIYDIPISRYIYVCYAADLAAGGERLLNILVSVGILALCVPWIIIYPIIGGFNIYIYSSIIYIYLRIHRKRPHRQLSTQHYQRQDLFPDLH